MNTFPNDVNVSIWHGRFTINFVIANAPQSGDDAQRGRERLQQGPPHHHDVKQREWQFDRELFRARQICMLSSPGQWQKSFCGHSKQHLWLEGCPMTEVVKAWFGFIPGWLNPSSLLPFPSPAPASAPILWSFDRGSESNWPTQSTAITATSSFDV